MTLQPVDILGVDAAILFSDILVVPEAMGINYDVIESKGPVFEKVVKNEKDIDSLKVAVAENLQYVLNAIKLVKKELNGNLPLIGFAGAPWTIFAYLVEGGSSKTFSKARKMLYTHPEVSHKLLDKITQSTINYLNAQVKSGVDIIQLFDSWAGVLNSKLYESFCIPYLRRICDEVKNIPKIIFPKDGHFTFHLLKDLNFDVIGLDWTITPKEVREKIGWKKSFQGNLDPCLLYANSKIIKEQTITMLKSFGPGKHIANLGHGVYPDTPLDGVKCFIDVIKSYRFEKKS